MQRRVSIPSELDRRAAFTARLLYPGRMVEESVSRYSDEDLAGLAERTDEELAHDAEKLIAILYGRSRHKGNPHSAAWLEIASQAVAKARLHAAAVPLKAPAVAREVQPDGFIPTPAPGTVGNAQ